MNNLYKKTKHVYTKIDFEICTDKGGADILINHSNGYSWVYFKTQKKMKTVSMDTMNIGIYHNVSCKTFIKLVKRMLKGKSFNLPYDLA